MKKLLPWILGMIVGIFVTVAFLGVLAINRLDEVRSEDPAYRLVAVSWGHSMKSSENWLYQVQVVSSPPDANGVMEISGRVCIGRSNHYHTMGYLGTATTMGEAMNQYGSIIWHEDRISIGGAEGEKASLLRSKLEKHR